MKKKLKLQKRERLNIFSLLFIYISFFLFFEKINLIETKSHKFQFIIEKKKK